MMTLLEWLQLGGIIALVAILVGAAVSGGLFKIFARHLEDVEPGARLTLLSTLLLLPVLVAIGGLAVVFAPSVLDALGLVRDHCHTHPGHHSFHACFVHSEPPPLSLGYSAALLAGFGYLAMAWGRTLSRAFQVRRRIRALRSFGSVDESEGVCRIDTSRPLAMTVGLLSPTIYLTAGLRDLLTSSQYRAVVSHEQTHAERLHSLLQLVGRGLRPLHFGGTGKALVSEIELACEQICDRAAAESVGDALSVAEAILALERNGTQAPEPGLSFGGSAVERRVEAMLDSDWRAPNWGLIVGVVFVAVSAVFSQYAWLHHAVETGLGFIL